MLCTCPLQIVNSTFSHPLIVHSDIISVSNKTIFDGCLDCGGVFILIYIVNRLLDGFPKTDFLPLTAFRVQAVPEEFGMVPGQEHGGGADLPRPVSGGGGEYQGH